MLRGDRCRLKMVRLGLCGVLAYLGTSGSAATVVEVQFVGGGAGSIAEGERKATAPMEKANVPGLSSAIINDSQVVYLKGFGVRDVETGEAVDENTVLHMADLQKILF